MNDNKLNENKGSDLSRLMGDISRHIKLDENNRTAAAKTEFSKQKLEAIPDKEQNNEGRVNSEHKDETQDSNYVVPRFLGRALRARARALNEDVHPYSIPLGIEESLRALDNSEGALSKGSRYRDENDIEAEDEEKEKEALAQQKSKDKNDFRQEEDNSGSLFYQKAKSYVEANKKNASKVSLSVKRNLKLLLIIIVGFIAYYGYGNYIRGSNNEIEELKSNLPYKLDTVTTIDRIEDTDTSLTMFISKNDPRYQSYTKEQVQAHLDLIAHNAQDLCKIPVIYSMIESGKKLTVLLSTQDKSLSSKFTVDKCSK